MSGEIRIIEFSTGEVLTGSFKNTGSITQKIDFGVPEININNMYEIYGELVAIFIVIMTYIWLKAFFKF